jgi:predicted transcriptional regulator YdeE
MTQPYFSSLKKSFSIEAAQPITTTNAAEATPQGKIGAYWGSFLEKYQQLITPENPLVVCYYNYESDYTAPYDFCMGIKGAVKNPDLKPMTIPAARYMVFTTNDASVQEVVATWGKIWNYFNETTEHKRAYSFDFQLHHADNF